MADTVSQGSLDSAGDEFVVVNPEPRLRIANNGDVKELESKLNEVLGDDHSDSHSVSQRMAASPTKPLHLPDKDGEKEKILINEENKETDEKMDQMKKDNGVEESGNVISFVCQAARKVMPWY